jgi:predicted alpha/beta hydrolase
MAKRPNPQGAGGESSSAETPPVVAAAPARRHSNISVPAADGFPLAATLFLPERDTGTVVLISPATAVLRRLYATLAEYLAARGCTVLTWDWRGTGDSRPASLRGFAGSMRTWAESDLEGVIQWAGGQFPKRSLTAVGHSFGGQAFGLAPSATRFKALVTIAAQSGYVGHWPLAQRAWLRVLWHVLMPTLSHTLGYFPARALRLGEDLPKGVALQWASWCTSPGYHGDLRRGARLEVPLLAYSIADDWIAPRRAVDALHASYTNCRVVRRHLSPRDLGVARIGHLGLLRPAHASVWEDIAGWLGGPSR